MMRIAIDFSSIASGGGLTHLEGLVSGLAQIDRSNSYDLLPPAAIPPGVRDLPENFRWRTDIARPGSALVRLLWEQVWLPQWLKRERFDVLLSAADRTVLLAPCPTVLLVQNPNPHQGPRSRTARGRAREMVLRQLTKVSARAARHVIYVSEYSRLSLSESIGVPLAKTTAVHHGVDEGFLSGASDAPGEEAREHRDQTARRWDLPPRYVMTAAAIRIHKDLPTLIRAFGRLAGLPELASHGLVVAGPIVDTGHLEELRALAAAEGIAERVRFLGDVPREQLRALYRGAELFVLPSLAETFGLPMIEALACGTPVVASRIPVAEEVCADYVVYFTPSDAEQLSDVMRELLSNEELRSRLGKRGPERAAQFSWTRCAARTLDVLRAAAGASGPSATYADHVMAPAETRLTG